MTSVRLGDGHGRFGGWERTIPYVAAALSLVAALIHLVVMPEHFEEWWGYGAFFLGATVFQGAYAPELLRFPRPWVFSLGIAVNLGVVLLWLMTRTVGIPLFGPHAGEVETVGGLDLIASAAELALALVLLAGLWLSQRPGTALPADPSRPADGGERALVGVLALAALALAGLSLWLYLSGRPPTDDSAEAGFARDMMVHHAQAVEMAEIVRDRTENPQIRILATDIALTQQAQIGQMLGWLEVWGLPPTGTESPMAWMGHPMDGPMPGMATPEEVERLGELPPGKADELFLRLMIAHHEAAIPMARAIIERSGEPEVELFAKKVIAAQKAEIENMQKMLKDMGAPPVKESPSMDGMDMGGHHGE